MKLFCRLIFVILALISVSCADSVSKSVKTDSDNQNNNSGTSTSDDDKKNDEETQNKVSVLFVNNSSYNVNVYFFTNPLDKSTPDTLVESGKSISVEMQESVNSNGDPFYFEYLIPIGNIIVPYFSFNNSKIHRIQKEKKNEIIIDELYECSTKSAYIILENNSTSAVYLKNINSIVRPANSDSELTDSGCSNVFLLGAGNGDFYYKTEQLAVSNAINTVKFPTVDFELGNIYSFVYDGNDVLLKSIIPFNLDSRKQIWNKLISDFYSDDTFKPVIRPAANLGAGSIMCGSLKNNRKAIGLLRTNVYGQSASEIPSAVFDSSCELETSAVLDFAEKDDGSIVLLLQNTYQNETAKQILACYNFENKSLKYIYTFTDTMSFNLSSRNKIILKDNKVYLAGSQISSGKMYPWFGILEESNKTTLSSWKSSNYSDFGSGIESMFTSVFYSENENCIYVCGYENCDFNYSSRIHKGIIYKFNSDLTSAEKIFEKDKTLFFSIDGDKNGNYFTCGEYADNGNILKGIIVSNKDVQNKTNGILFTTEDSYCWFNQLCVYDSKIMLCGKSENKFSATSNSKPFTACYTFSGKLMWVNNSFQNYTDAVTIIPNKINTYNLELYNSGTRSILLKSADLLGK